ncbi:MAG: bifunctional phosphopantothenoylcysteine decarboxylase/phosphopantothenate--cysteine ligase CoaBC [Bacteroidota bacterium]
MSIFGGKKILLGITAGIAAYKTASLVRLFIKSGAEVQVVMTPASKDFITPLTLSTLSKNPVHSTFYDKEEENELWNNHVELGLWADYILIAPATANTLSKMTNGECDNLLLATYLSAKCPVYFAPAMDLDMYKHPSTKRSLEKLQEYGNIMIPATSGELASGLVGAGRMAEPEEIVSLLNSFFVQKQDLLGKTVLITAGPTYEPLDPVRFIGNRSSGKMGLALAEELASRGAKVHLVLGPSKLSASHPNVKTTRIGTAQEMYESALQHFPHCEVVILAAAVADYRPAAIADKKIKKKTDDLSIQLEKTPDIAAHLGKMKTDQQIIVGFALETNNELEYAQQKRIKKNFDFIVLNSLRDKGAGFNHDTNKIRIIHDDQKVIDFELKSKKAVAVDIVNELLKVINKEVV